MAAVSWHIRTQERASQAASRAQVLKRLLGHRELARSLIENGARFEIESGARAGPLLLDLGTTCKVCHYWRLLPVPGSQGME